jgi:flagellar biosynthesis anti-sigma factor FlgM
MRIADPNSPGNALPAETSAPQPAAHPPIDPPATGAIGVGSDHAELSSVADRLTGMLQTDSAARAGRVRQLKEAVASGTYEVDAPAVSRALVNEALSAGNEPEKP